MWVRKFDSKSLTKTKNWRVRNEVTETSGRLHPLWPQNKWLHTPRITDYRHTIQDRRIQTELAFTLAKNATKPNPFEIIPLQTTRKENNWKTEEALARAAVTVETERIKGSNHWCLWWWWWWWWWQYNIGTKFTNVAKGSGLENPTADGKQQQCVGHKWHRATGLQNVSRHIDRQTDIQLG